MSCRIMSCALVAALISTAAGADCFERPDRISILLGSEHVNATTDYTEFNPGVFLSWDCESIILTAGVYTNSFGDASPSALVSYPIIKTNDGSLAAFAGASYFPDVEGLDLGYSGNVVPLMGMQLNYKNTFVQVLPGVEDSFDLLITAGLRFHLN